MEEKEDALYIPFVRPYIINIIMEQNYISE